MSNYDKDLEIDPNNLDQEWLLQPRLFMNYSAELTDARRDSAFIAEKLEVTKAEADKRVRLQFVDQKVTVDQIRAAVQQDVEVQKIARDAIEAEHKVNMLQAAVRSFDQRKDALENLVRLHGQNYFAGPTVPHNIGREFRKQIDEKGKESARDAAVERTGRGRRG